MDEEELQKRFTDCVYFLASPLTCKKGIDCEYRHCEIARLNPRDCWYWLGGCCFNPDCAFRHPPLEGLKETYYESSNPNNGPALPAEKTSIPCYFYSKGFCNKGDRCTFLHGPSASTANTTVPPEKKLSSGSNAGPTIVESNPDQPENAEITHTYTVRKDIEGSHQLASGSPERRESPDTSANQSEEDADRSLEEFVQSESDDPNDQNSDQLEDGYVERERWLDSSPGFDVLVEGESERLHYEENDAGYFSVHDEEQREFDVRYSEYDPAYPELGNRFRQESYDYDRMDKMFGQSRESIFNRLSFKNRNLQMAPKFYSRRGPDNCDHLKKRKVFDFDYRIRRNPPRHGSHVEVDFDHSGWLRKAVSVTKYRHPLKKPHVFSYEVSRLRKPAQQQKRKPREESDSAVFTGPKTLDQIKEEKKKALQYGDLGSVKRTKSDDFQGPRPLSEILKNKRKLN